ncbi:hypothetical protein [Leifsonia sp. NPDC058230]|uniref:hypothetical protein n=1 Tax=Leifsonia sp. NPDC058230 TaxID=3346391 RepID=UPI0036D83788
MSTNTLASASTGKRLSVPLTARDLADLDLIRNSPERLDALPGDVDASSEASLVHAVFIAGLERLREAAEAAGYAAYAADPEFQEYRAARRAGGERQRPE